MRVVNVESTELFVSSADGPAQVLRVTVDQVSEPIGLTAEVAGRIVGQVPAGIGAETVELPVPGLAALARDQPVSVQVSAPGAAPRTAEVTIAAPGWTVWMIPHFHYDPVWWNTQAAYTATWDELGEAAQRTRMAFQQTGFTLVRAHLEAARADPDYKFVLAEVDYLKPYWDANPQDRTYLRRLLADGRLEIMGGTYNEPNTNLTSAETTARNFVYGAGFQRQVLGADPRTAWQLDVFGHDPQFPGMAADAGLTSSSWARGPFHQWGPMLTTHAPVDGWGEASAMQFDAEFEWLSPSGRGVLTHYMPAHYSAGWQIDSQTSLAEAEAAVYHLFLRLKKVAATRNVLLPVGTDYTPPSKWVTEIHRDWGQRYLWPRLRCALPGEFFEAVRAELRTQNRQVSAQTRDMNPVYTGKDVSYIDTKQVQRAAESVLVDAEKFATIAAMHGARFPYEVMDKAWRQLVYGAHHDAITGSESDQVYLDLLTGWREAHDLGGRVLTNSLRYLAARVQRSSSSGHQSLTVFNPSSWPRTELVELEIELPETGVELLDPEGVPVPCLISAPTSGPAGARARLTFLASVPAFGYRSGWRLRQRQQPADVGWTEQAGGTVIETDRFRITVDPQRGGCVSEFLDKRAGRSLLQPGDVGNELLLEQEYPEHPTFHEGPWHLVPTGSAVGSSSVTADSVTIARSVLGERVRITGRLGALKYEQQLTVWHGLDRVDCATFIDDFDGSDQLLRVRWPVRVPGALPVSEVGDAVVGRGFALLGADSAEHPWTLDNPAYSWFALSSTARVRISEPSASAPAVERAIGVAELIAADPTADELRQLAVALAGQGVTATTSRDSGPRYGLLAVDSNLPDVRIVLGGPEENEFTRSVLGMVDSHYRVEFAKQLAQSGTARLWIPAERALRQVWRPSADLTGPTALPVLLIAGPGAAAELAADLADAAIDVVQSASATTRDEQQLDDYTVGLLNTGLPGFAVDASGAMHLSLQRACTGWPSGVWIDSPRRTAPDGSSFQLQHWTHQFDYALVAGPGDWRDVGLVRAGHDYNHELRAVLAVEADPADWLPAMHSFLQFDPDAQMVLAALKPRGNPLAAGTAPGPVKGVSLRLFEAAGRSAAVSLRTGFTAAEPTALTLLETDGGEADFTATGDGAFRLALGPMQITTVGLAVPQRAAAELADLAERAEPHQPVYARYWLNNTGPAPIGNLPVSVHFEPTVVEYPTAGREPVELTLRVASDRTDVETVGTVELIMPSGWSATSAGAATGNGPVVAGPELRYALAAGAYTEYRIRLTPPQGVADGVYWLRARITDSEQLVEDVCRIIVGDAADELQVSISGPDAVSVGERTWVEVSLTSGAATPISAQLQLISPGPVWPMLPVWNTGVTVETLGRQTVRLPLNVPVGTRAGTWWVLAKVACAGLLHYTEALPITVLP